MRTMRDPTRRASWREQGRSRAHAGFVAGWRGLLRVLAAMALLSCPTLAAAQSEIVLRPSVRVGAGDVLLRDVAEITGSEAIALADTVVLAAGEIKPGARMPVDADTVRGVLTKANANWSRVNLSGSACWVMRRAEGPSGARVNTAAVNGAPMPTPIAAEAGDGPTVRTSIPVRLAEFLGVEIDDLRLTYDAGDAGLLNTPTAGRIVEIAPGGSAERVPMQVSVYSNGPEGMTLVASGTVRVGVQVRREMAVARTLLGRGRAVTEADVVFEERWVRPSERSPTREELIGSAVRGRVQAGAVVSADEVETPYLVRKGQVVSVRTVTSSVVLKSTARAMNNAKLGEEVKLQSLNATSTKDRGGAMTGRVDGPGRVIVGVISPVEGRQERPSDGASQALPAQNTELGVGSFGVGTFGQNVKTVDGRSEATQTTLRRARVSAGVVPEAVAVHVGPGGAERVRAGGVQIKRERREHK